MEEARGELEQLGSVPFALPADLRGASVTRDGAFGGCLHNLFEAQVELRPNAIALVSPSLTLSYFELDQRANQIAHCLHFFGVGPGKFVGIYMDKSVHPIIAILGVLKSGAAYVPLDPAYPEERIRHILSESEMSVLLTESSLKEKAGVFHTGHTLVLDEQSDVLSKQPYYRLPQTKSKVQPSDLCYVLYTSGTTGRPKGVMTEHRNAYQFTVAFNKTCGTDLNDRVMQNFSFGFDGSVEEIWMAFSNGSTLIIGDKSTPKFGNDLATFMREMGITYFSTVPTMLSTFTEPIPSLKHLVVSGEVCPPELVTQWAGPTVKMWNVYGPTEATVNTTVKLCLPGKPVTIGTPVEGYTAFILDEQRKPVFPGEKGELYIGGVGLCRGYLKQATLTDERFVASPYVLDETGKPERLYRTGDLARFNQEGELEFFGRIDSQVKIRGYRVELAEIESVLREHENIRSASVKLFERDGIQELAAYIVLKDPKTSLDRNSVFNQISSRVPPYMIPNYLDVLEALPMLTSGKVDRKALPLPVAPLLKEASVLVEAENELEAGIAKIWAEIFGAKKISVEDDFFLNLGGHSLLAAQMVTRLRTQLFLDVAVRDVYGNPTVRKLARTLATRSQPTANETKKLKEPTSREVYESLSKATRVLVPILQAFSIYAMAGIGSSLFCIFFLWVVNCISGTMPFWTLVGYTILLSLVLWPVFLVAGILAKWILIGRYKEGKHKVWGWYYFRWWIAGRLQAMSGIGGFLGTPLMPIFLRLMGAKIGHNCHLNSAAAGSYDLLTIGDDTSIGADTQYTGYRIENGYLHIGRIEIGSRCFIGTHSALGLRTKMEDDCLLDDQSLLPDGAMMKKGETMKGSPAHLAQVHVPPAQPTKPSRAKKLGFAFIQIACAYGMAYLFLIPTILFLLAYWAGYVADGLVGIGALLLVSVPIAVVVYCLALVAAKRLVLYRANPGIYRVYGRFYLRKWLSDGLMGASRALLLPVYTTIYLPPWMRLMGAKIGKRAEMSTIWHLSPELVEIGDESFFADGSMIGGKRLYGGSFELGKNQIGRRSFVGNSALLPMGRGLGNGCLLGVLSVPPDHHRPNVHDGTDWLGSPAFELPNRQKVGKFADAVTFQPTRKLYMQRMFVDGLRVLIPGYIALFAAVVGLLLLYVSLIKLGTLGMFLVAPGIGLLVGVLVMLTVAAIKWTVMGTFQPVVKPLWSMYVWLNEMVNGIYETVMAPFLVGFLGTPFVAPFLRLMGIKVGKHTYIESVLFSEFDLIDIRDYAALNSGAIVQNHLFEDRIMKSDRLVIGEGCTVGNMAVVLYNTEMLEGSILDPMSLLMKGEVINPHTRWHGIPVVQKRD